MSPELEDLIEQLSEKGMNEEQVYAALKSTTKINESFTLNDVCITMSRRRMGQNILGRNKGPAHGRRIFGALCLLGGLYVLFFVGSDTTGLASMSKKVGGYALLLSLLGAILIFKPRAELD
ncbi:hypothetical protein [Rubritalea marina]|uniref:hypothetical protein n=1 Tax=Rubritalea marina TaxID=361055 RepID=UPI0003744100|nr:hypothetical protein [Rubritalea marina]